MGQTLCALAAGLLVGQAQEITVVDSQSVGPTTSSGWTQVPNGMKTRSWTQTGTWNSSTGWTWRTTVNDSAPDGSILSRLSDRLGEMFGTHPQTTPPGAGRRSAGWHEEGAKEFKSGAAAGPGPRMEAVPGIAAQTAEPPLAMPLPVRTTYNEPPLLEVTVESPVADPAQPVTIKPASFKPAQVQDKGTEAIPARLADKVGHEDDYSWITGQLEIDNGLFMVRYAAPKNDRFGGRMLVHGDIDLSDFKSGDLVTLRGSVLQGRAISIYRVETIDLIERTAK